MSNAAKDLPRIAEQIFSLASESEERMAWYIQPPGYKGSDRACIFIDGKMFDVSINRIMNFKTAAEVLEYLETEYAIHAIAGK